MDNKTLAKQLIDSINDNEIKYLIPLLRELSSPLTISNEDLYEYNPNKDLYTVEDIFHLPNFIKVELLDGEILTDAYTKLVIDDDVFMAHPSCEYPVTYRLSIVSNDTNSSNT